MHWLLGIRCSHNCHKKHGDPVKGGFCSRRNRQQVRYSIRVSKYKNTHKQPRRPDTKTRVISVTPATIPCLHGTDTQPPSRRLRGEWEGAGKRTHPTDAAVLILASHSLMLAQLSQETRGSCQGGVSLTAKQTTSRVQYPCDQIQQYTQTIKTSGQENPRKAFCVGRLAAP